MLNVLEYLNSSNRVRVYQVEGAPTQTDSIDTGSLALDLTNGHLYSFDGSSWGTPLADGAINTDQLADEAVTWTKSGTEVIGSASYGNMARIKFVIPASALDTNANSILEVPGNIEVVDVGLTLTNVAGAACTVNIGTDDSNWQFHNNDPDAFIAAFDANSSNNAVNMRMLDETNQTAAAVSGDAASGTSNIILTSSADRSATAVSIIATVWLARVDLSIFS